MGRIRLFRRKGLRREGGEDDSDGNVVGGTHVREKKEPPRAPVIGARGGGVGYGAMEIRHCWLSAPP